MKKKNRYIACVMNDQGAGEFAREDTNLNKLKSYIRNHYGQGWIVTIDKISNDSGIMDFAPEQICKFRIRNE